MSYNEDVTRERGGSERRRFSSRRLDSMHLFVLTVICALSACASEPVHALWDREESIEAYAKRVDLPVTRTIVLADGVTMEFVLIPAATFTMGTPEPHPPNELLFVNQRWLGQSSLAVSAAVLLTTVIFVIVRAIQKNQRPQVSLARLVFLVLVAGWAVWGGLHWLQAERKNVSAKKEYAAARARYANSGSWGEKQAHEVTLSFPFYIGRYEVSQEQYQRIMGTNPSPSKGYNLPVDKVCWYDAQLFCKLVSTRTGVGIALPTEAEWEHACRAGTKTNYYTGDRDVDLDRAGWYIANSKCRTHPVGQKAPNQWGIYDMHGNVSEHCQDVFGWYDLSRTTDPQGAKVDTGRTRGSESRVVRGGSCREEKGRCRSAFRAFSLMHSRQHGLGFRVVIATRRTNVSVPVEGYLGE